MSGICSRHRHHDPDCPLCGRTPADLFGAESWSRALARAKAAGTHVCAACGFKFYKTIAFCPKCTHPIDPPTGAPTGAPKGTTP